MHLCFGGSFFSTVPEGVACGTRASVSFKNWTLALPKACVAALLQLLLLQFAALAEYVKPCSATAALTVLYSPWLSRARWLLLLLFFLPLLPFSPLVELGQPSIL